MKKNDVGTFLSGERLYSNDINQLLNSFDNSLKSSNKTVKIFTPNPEQIVLAQDNKTFAKTLGLADILIPDGVGLVIASQILASFGKAKSVVERITGVDVTVGLLNIANINNYKVLIIGGREYENSQYEDWDIVEVSNQKSFDQQKTLWWSKGFSNVKSQTKSEIDQISKAVKSIKPDIVFVALGAPYQEQWILDNQAMLETAGVKISMVVGGTFDMLLGKMSRAPKFIQTIGLEWLFRLIQEPWRWRRQVKLLSFIKIVVRRVFF